LPFSVFRLACEATDWSNLEMLIERRAQAQERVVPETIARFLREAAEFVPLALKTIPSHERPARVDVHRARVVDGRSLALSKTRPAKA
jgi:hypothetical protein